MRLWLRPSKLRRNQHVGNRFVILLSQLGLSLPQATARAHAIKDALSGGPSPSFSWSRVFVVGVPISFSW